MTKRTSPFLESVREAIRSRRCYSAHTEYAYVAWIRRFIPFHAKRHPRDMGARQVGEFLAYLAVRGRVATDTRSQALDALVFLYAEVLDRPLDAVPRCGSGNTEVECGHRAAVNTSGANQRVFRI